VLGTPTDPFDPNGNPEQPNYLHDGRARSLMEAILWHGGEADAARDAVLAMTRRARRADRVRGVPVRRPRRIPRIGGQTGGSRRIMRPAGARDADRRQTRAHRDGPPHKLRINIDLRLTTTPAAPPALGHLRVTPISCPSLPAAKSAKIFLRFARRF
jgi:hypothetical protein